MTNYTVLIQEGACWRVVGTSVIEARSDEHAIRKVIDAHDSISDGDVLVAVPTRSWRPQKVSIQQRLPLINVAPA